MKVLFRQYWKWVIVDQHYETQEMSWRRKMIVNFMFLNIHRLNNNVMYLSEKFISFFFQSKFNFNCFSEPVIISVFPHFICSSQVSAWSMQRDLWSVSMFNLHPADCIATVSLQPNQSSTSAHTGPQQGLVPRSTVPNCPLWYTTFWF